MLSPSPQPSQSEKWKLSIRDLSLIASKCLNPRQPSSPHHPHRKPSHNPFRDLSLNRSPKINPFKDLNPNHSPNLNPFRDLNPKINLYQDLSQLQDLSHSLSHNQDPFQDLNLLLGLSLRFLLLKEHLRQVSLHPLRLPRSLPMLQLQIPLRLLSHP